jgi:hypothetical protein
MKLLGKIALAGALSLISLPALAHDHHGWRGHCPPGHDHAPGWRGDPGAVHRDVWVPGHWVRRRGAHVWIGAGWNVPPQPAWIWVEPHWVWGSGGWQWQEAHWAPPS